MRQQGMPYCTYHSTSRPTYKNNQPTAQHQHLIKRTTLSTAIPQNVTKQMPPLFLYKILVNLISRYERDSWISNWWRCWFLGFWKMSRVSICLLPATRLPERFQKLIVVWSSQLLYGLGAWQIDVPSPWCWTWRFINLQCLGWQFWSVEDRNNRVLTVAFHDCLPDILPLGTFQHFQLCPQPYCDAPPSTPSSPHGMGWESNQCLCMHHGQASVSLKQTWNRPQKMEIWCYALWQVPDSDLTVNGRKEGLVCNIYIFKSWGYCRWHFRTQQLVGFCSCPVNRSTFVTYWLRLKRKNLRFSISTLIPDDRIHRFHVSFAKAEKRIFGILPLLCTHACLCLAADFKVNIKTFKSPFYTRRYHYMI